MKIKKVVALGLTMAILGGTAVFASTPAEIYSEVAGVTVEEAYQARQNGETYGKLADDKDLFEEFRQKMLEERIQNCDPQNPQRQGQRMGGRRKGNGNFQGRSRQNCILQSEGTVQ